MCSWNSLTNQTWPADVSETRVEQRQVSALLQVSVCQLFRKWIKPPTVHRLCSQVSVIKGKKPQGCRTCEDVLTLRHAAEAQSEKGDHYCSWLLVSTRVYPYLTTPQGQLLYLAPRCCLAQRLIRHSGIVWELKESPRICARQTDNDILGDWRSEGQK